MTEFESKYDRAILIITLPSWSHLNSPRYLRGPIATAARRTRKRLLIVVLSDLFDEPRLGGLSQTNSWQDVQQFLTFTYVEATRVAQELDNVLLSVDVALHAFNPERTSLSRHDNAPWDTLFRLEGDETPISSELSIARLPTITLSITATEPIPEVTQHEFIYSEHPPSYPVVALGGTFDHLHAGHKILLSMGAWITNQRLIVGVTDDVLLKKKTNTEYLESLEARMQAVRDFGEIFKPTIIYDVVPIHDVYGPTGWDSNIQALVVSGETLSGATSIAKQREEKALPALDTYVIDVISYTSLKLDLKDSENMRKAKMSSTFIRGWISAKEKRGEHVV